jgi:endoglucanase
VNIAGFDFGCNSAGQCTNGGWYDIVRDTNGVQQMQHLASIGLNAFRLPIGWQYIVNNVLGGPINTTSDYYTLVQACLDTGAKMCIIDIHNYARWNGQIIGQGGPTNAQYANLWSQIATKYASESRIAFDVMNEPHDIPSIPTWAASVQAAVTAIRQAGATSQIILLPGDNWTSAGTFVSGGSADALNAVTNPDGSKTNLIMNVHKYLDSDNSGTTTECVTNNIDGAFAPLATWLRANKRQAMLTETGGGNVASCETYLCQELAYLKYAPPFLLISYSILSI